MSTNTIYASRLTPLVLLAFVLACGSQPTVKDLPAGTDPQSEIGRLESDFQKAKQDEVDLLSPENFEMAVKSKDQAVEARSKNKDQEYVLGRLASSQAYLTAALGVAKVGHEVLQAPLLARRDAMAANAVKIFDKESGTVDAEFRRVSHYLESNDTGVAMKERDKLTNQYRSLEVRSIVKANLGQAENTLNEARSEGAKSLTPKALATAEATYKSSLTAIEAQPHDAQVIQKSVLGANQAADRLLRMVRTAKNSKVMNPEDFANQAELNDRHGRLMKQDLSVATGDLADVTNKNAAMSEQVSLDDKYREISEMFNADEAQVYKQGDSVVIRLRGLAFLNNNSTLNPSSYPLMTKVQQAIASVGPKNILIEGHTDSSGTQKLNRKLSAQRADTVMAYLSANKSLGEAQAEAKGFADSKPIASNKTAHGRSENRRVDIVLMNK